MPKGKRNYNTDPEWIEARKREARRAFIALADLGETVSAAVIRGLAKEYHFSLADIGTSEEELERLVAEAPKAQARTTVARLREKPDFFWIGSLRDKVKAGVFSLSDIGTSEEELEQLLERARMDAALYWLTQLRKEPSNSAIHHVREALTKSGLSLTDIGTSEEELEQLRVKGCMDSALYWLTQLRKDPVDNWNQRFMQDSLKQGGFSIADMDMSAEEIETIVVQPRKQKAKRLLEQMRAFLDSATSKLRDMESIAKEGSFSLADIGMTEEEINFFTQRRVQT